MTSFFGNFPSASVRAGTGGSLSAAGQDHRIELPFSVTIVYHKFPGSCSFHFLHFTSIDDFNSKRLQFVAKHIQYRRCLFTDRIQISVFFLDQKPYFLKKANGVLRTEAFQRLLYPCSISSMVTFHREIFVAQIAFSVSCL